MSLADLELSGLSALANGKSTTLDDARLLEHAGLFGVNMFVCGLGLRALSEHHEAGAILMKLGGVLGASMYGTRYLVMEDAPGPVAPKAKTGSTGATNSSSWLMWLPIGLTVAVLGAVVHKGSSGWGAPSPPDEDPRRDWKLAELQHAEELLGLYPRHARDHNTRSFRAIQEREYKRLYRELFGEDPKEIP